MTFSHLITTLVYTLAQSQATETLQLPERKLIENVIVVRVQRSQEQNVQTFPKPIVLCTLNSTLRRTLSQDSEFEGAGAERGEERCWISPPREKKSSKIYEETEITPIRTCPEKIQKRCPRSLQVVVGAPVSDGSK